MSSVSHWNPTFYFDTLVGGISSDEFKERTLAITIEDNAREYDQIEITLNNSDGELTKLENIALGLALRIRYGYQSNTSAWRTFIISRMRGGVGRAGYAKPVAMNDTNATIVYSGRNRNAPDVKTRGNAGAKENKPTGKGRGTRIASGRGRASSPIVALDSKKRDSWSGPTEGSRVFQVHRLSDAIREIALRDGYAANRIFIQDTEDQVNSIVIPEGMTTADFLRLSQERLGWHWKVTKDEFYFHEPRWKEGPDQEVRTYAYGSDDTILDLSLDMDFRLPIPRKVKTKAHNPLTRSTTIVDQDSVASGISNAATELTFIDADRDKHLRRDDIFMATGVTQNLAGYRAQRSFFEKVQRAVQITLTVVGDPTLTAGEQIRITGTGTPIVDTVWFVEQVRHVFDGQTYVCVLALRVPRKPKKGASLRTEALVVDEEARKKGISAPATILGFINAPNQSLKRNSPTQ